MHITDIVKPTSQKDEYMHRHMAQKQKKASKHEQGFLQVFCSKFPDFSSHRMTISLTLSKQ